MKFKALIASATAALMTACGSVDVDQYAKETPKLELSSFSLERLMPGEFFKNAMAKLRVVFTSRS